jgi:AAA family ATP:ADP antiporter
MDTSPAVRAEAVGYLCEHGHGDPRELIHDYLNSSDEKVRGAAIDALTTYQMDGVDVEPIVSDLLGESNIGSKTNRLHAAKALGLVDPDSRLHDRLSQLLKDDSVDVLRHAVVSAGKVRRRELVPILVGKLRDRDLRRYVRDALANYGEGVVGTLGDYVDDRAENIVIRYNVLGALVQIRSQRTVQTLMKSMDLGDVSIRSRVIRALGRMREKYPELTFNWASVKGYVNDEMKSYYQLATILASVDDTNSSGEAAKLLNRALRERMKENLDMIFVLLGLRYRQRDMSIAYGGVQSEDRTTKARAVELLDNLIERGLKSRLIPVVEGTTLETLAERGKLLFRIESRSRIEQLENLITGKDRWLATCAIYAAGEAGYKNLLGTIERLGNSPDQVVREAAGLALGRIGGTAKA